MNATTTTIHITYRYPVSAEQVFDAWLSPKSAGKWLFATPTGEMIRAEIDARVGGTFIFTDRRDGEDVEHTGTYLEINRPKRLVFSFGVPKFSPLMTTVAIDITTLGSGCELKLTHEGVLTEWAEKSKEGWGGILESLEKNLS